MEHSVIHTLIDAWMLEHFVTVNGQLRGSRSIALQRENGECDLADFVFGLHHRLRHGKFVGDRWILFSLMRFRISQWVKLLCFKYVCNDVEEGFVCITNNFQGLPGCDVFYLLWSCNARICLGLGF